jgi:hypothetical protein
MARSYGLVVFCGHGAFLRFGVFRGHGPLLRFGGVSWAWVVPTVWWCFVGMGRSYGLVCFAGMARSYGLVVFCGHGSFLRFGGVLWAWGVPTVWCVSRAWPAPTHCYPVGAGHARDRMD